MTVQEILANNSKEEDVVIIVHSKEQYEDFMRLLDTQGYHWGNGEKVYGENQWIPNCFKTEDDYILLTISIYSKTNTIAYVNFFYDGFSLGEFRDSVSFLFGIDNDDEAPFASIYKPYLTLKREIEELAEDYEI